MNTSHYYGNIVRVIFIACAIYILWGLPRMTQIIGVPVALPIIAVVVMVIAAGVTNPIQKSALILNVCASVVFLIGFTYLGWVSYFEAISPKVELANQIVSVAFLVASYLSIKSLRGAFVRDARA